MCNQEKKKARRLDNGTHTMTNNTNCKKKKENAFDFLRAL